jgi:hypothetical protein
MVDEASEEFGLVGVNRADNQVPAEFPFWRHMSDAAVT